MTQAQVSVDELAEFEEFQKQKAEKAAREARASGIIPGLVIADDDSLNQVIASTTEGVLAGTLARMVLTAGGICRFATHWEFPELVTANGTVIPAHIVTKGMLATPMLVLTELTLASASYREYEGGPERAEGARYQTLQTSWWAPNSRLGEALDTGQMRPIDPFQGRPDRQGRHFRFSGSTQGIPEGRVRVDALIELLKQRGWAEGEFGPGVIDQTAQRENDNDYKRHIRLVPNTGMANYRAHLGAILGQDPALPLKYGLEVDSVTLQTAVSEQNPTGFKDPITSVLTTMGYDVEDSAYVTEHGKEAEDSQRKRNIGLHAESLTGSRYQNGPTGAPDVATQRQAGRARVPSVVVEGVEYSFYDN